MISVLAVAGDAPFQPLHPMRYWGFQFWSGLGADIAELSVLVGVVTGLLWIYRHFRCHAGTCRRLGFHHVAGTPFRVCWHHHPILSQHGHHRVPLHCIWRDHEREVRLGRRPSG